MRTQERKKQRMYKEVGARDFFLKKKGEKKCLEESLLSLPPTLDPDLTLALALSPAPAPSLRKAVRYNTIRCRMHACKQASQRLLCSTYGADSRHSRDMHEYALL